MLANLCVSYILTFQNGAAEDLIKKIQRAEELRGNLSERNRHSQIINLVVGTLYCSKSNYEFGLSRVFQALDDGSRTRLCANTWYHVKRCILGLLTAMSRQEVILAHAVLNEVLHFLRSCEGW